VSRWAFNLPVWLLAALLGLSPLSARAAGDDDDDESDAPPPPARGGAMLMGPAVIEAYSFGEFRMTRGSLGGRAQRLNVPVPDGVTPRGLAVDLGGAGICYDLDSLRVIGAWTGGFLTWKRVHKDRFFEVAGTTFMTGLQHVPGWARNGSFEDPRPLGWGPLPADWARYRGHYLHGDQTILHYSVGATVALESPVAVRAGNLTGVARRFTIGPGNERLTMLVADDANGAGLRIAGLPTGAVAVNQPEQETVLLAGGVNLPAGAAWRFDQKRLVLDLPARAAPVSFAVVLAETSLNAVAGFGRLLAVDTPSLQALTKGGPKRWGDGVTLAGTIGPDEHAYTVDTITAPQSNPWNAPITAGGFDFFSDGRAAVCTWDGDLYIVSGIDDKLDRVTWRRFATGLFQPLGVRIVNDIVHVTAKDGLKRLHDLNGNGEADYYEQFNGDHVTNLGGHVFSFNLETDRAGNFYYTIGGHRGTIAPQNHSLCVVRVAPDGSKMEIIATGFREPNGFSIGPDDVMIVGDNPSGKKPSTPLDVITEGGRYGYKRDWDRFRPMLWLTHEADGSAGSQAWVTSNRWGPIRSGLVHTSYSRSALLYVMPDRKAGAAQAAAVLFPLRFYSGIMRARFRPQDGQLYVCGLRGWDTNAATPGCFERVRATGLPWRAPLEYEVTRTGLRLSWGCALDPTIANDPGSWAISNFSHVRRQIPDGPVEFSRVTLLPDGRTVELIFPEFKPYDNLIIRYRLRCADGVPANGQVWATINQLPD
jgi:hypothetical protein